MKYLILVICALFCLPSFSDHTENPVSDQERNRYYELANKALTTKKQAMEYLELDRKIMKEIESIYSHWNKYASLEYLLSEAEKGNSYDQRTLSRRLLILHFKLKLLAPNLTSYYVEGRKLHDQIPNCTEEKLEKAECPEPPYMAIYWARKSFESGKCVEYAARDFFELINHYVIGKTDIRSHESVFFILRYIAAYFYYHKTLRLMAVKNYERNLKKEKALKEKGELTEYLKKDFENQKENSKKRMEFLSKSHKNIRKTLNEKQKQIADRKINDLIQKWSDEGGKDKIYECELEYTPIDTEIQKHKEFLDKEYIFLE